MAEPNYTPKIGDTSTSLKTCHACQKVSDIDRMVTCSNKACRTTFCYACTKRNYHKFSGRIFAILKSNEKSGRWRCYKCKGKCKCPTCRIKLKRITYKNTPGNNLMIGRKRNFENEPETLAEKFNIKLLANAKGVLIEEYPIYEYEDDEMSHDDAKPEQHLDRKEVGPESGQDITLTNYNSHASKKFNEKLKNESEALDDLKHKDHPCNMLGGVYCDTYYKDHYPRRILPKPCILCENNNFLSEEMLKFKSTEEFILNLKFFIDRKKHELKESQPCSSKCGECNVCNYEINKNLFYSKVFPEHCRDNFKLTDSKLVCQNCIVSKLNESNGLIKILSMVCHSNPDSISEQEIQMSDEDIRKQSPEDTNIKENSAIEDSSNIFNRIFGTQREESNLHHQPKQTEQIQALDKDKQIINFHMNVSKFFIREMNVLLETENEFLQQDVNYIGKLRDNNNKMFSLLKDYTLKIQSLTEDPENP